MKEKVLFVALATFVALHQDTWLWNDSTLVLGFLPSGLAYHAGYSLATAVLWAVVALKAWPESLADSDTTLDDGEDRSL